MNKSQFTTGNLVLLSLCLSANKIGARPTCRTRQKNMTSLPRISSDVQNEACGLFVCCISA